MAKQNIINKLNDTLERTGYVTDIKIFSGEFHEDSRLDLAPEVSYVVNFKDNKKDTKLHYLEKEINQGFFNGHYSDCKIRTCIEEISENQEKHTIHVQFNGENHNNQSKTKRTIKMARHLNKIIEDCHFKE